MRLGVQQTLTLCLQHRIKLGLGIDNNDGDGFKIELGTGLTTSAQFEIETDSDVLLDGSTLFVDASANSVGFGATALGKKLILKDQHLIYKR